MDFTIKRTNRDYVLIRKNGTYEQHAHFKRRSGAEKAITLIKLMVIPKSEYFRIALKRLLTEEEYSQLRVKPVKDRYYNVGKKVRRVGCK